LLNLNARLLRLRLSRELEWEAHSAAERIDAKTFTAPGNAAQHVVASHCIRTGLCCEESVEIEEAIRRTIAWEQQNVPTTDARSDLYSLGVTMYQMPTGTLPFAAADPLEWVHCHIARQPTPPGERAPVPEPLSAITMKLLAKNAKERYQTASGLEADLRLCLAEWESHGLIDPFPLGEHDASEQLLIPEKLYGREREVNGRLAAFDRGRNPGHPRTSAGVRLFRNWQILSGERAAQGAGSAARAFRGRQVRLVQERHTLYHAGAGRPDSDPPDPRKERGGGGTGALFSGGGSWTKWPAHRWPHSRSGVRHRQTAARCGAVRRERRKTACRPTAP
jgi:hypothetical protein